MNKPATALDNVRVASPCTARWDQMQGDERSRFCSECKLSVYNLSAMTKDEASAFVAGAEGRVCIRYYQRADGTMLTADCPVGVRAVRMRFTRRVRSMTAAALALVATGVGASSMRAGGSPKMGKMVAPAVEVDRVDTARHADTTGSVHDNTPAENGTDTVSANDATAPNHHPQPPEEMGYYVMGGMMPIQVEVHTVQPAESPSDPVADTVNSLPVSRNEEPEIAERRDDEPAFNGPDTVIEFEINPIVDLPLESQPRQTVAEPEAVIVREVVVEPPSRIE